MLGISLGFGARRGREEGSGATGALTNDGDFLGLFFDGEPRVNDLPSVSEDTCSGCAREPEGGEAFELAGTCGVAFGVTAGAGGVAGIGEAWGEAGR